MQVNWQNLTKWYIYMWYITPIDRPRNVSIGEEGNVLWMPFNLIFLSSVFLKRMVNWDFEAQQYVEFIQICTGNKQNEQKCISMHDTLNLYCFNTDSVVVPQSCSLFADMLISQILKMSLYQNSFSTVQCSLVVALLVLLYFGIYFKLI